MFDLLKITTYSVYVHELCIEKAYIAAFDLILPTRLVVIYNYSVVS